MPKGYQNNDQAISPVIGTILMIAATVIIAGAVYAAVNAYSGHSSKPPTSASWKAAAIDNSTGGSRQQIRIAYLSGANPAQATTVTVKDASGNTVSSYQVAPPGSWHPGDFAVAAPAADGTYYVTVVEGTNTVMDGTVDVTG